MSGPLTLLGIGVLDLDEALEVATWWRVDDGPIERNFSLMGHLISGDGAVLGSDDGAGVHPTTLLAGDVFVQRHRFSPVDDDAEIWFRTGGYWLDTKARWTTGDGQTDAFVARLR
jgi:hypothetical protein